MTNETGQSPAEFETYDLCVIGAGAAGLNALFVATEYLPRTARVLLIDRNADSGGMWTGTYDYLRMHQPYEMFTTGDVRWELRMPREYLASGAEVLDHLKHCRDTIRGRIDLTEIYGSNVDTLEEIETAEGPRVRVRFSGLNEDGPVDEVLAKQVVRAPGMNITPTRPLKLSSDAVISTTPELLRQQGDALKNAPAVVVGGGKTGMDTVLELLAQNPDRRITVINGKGTVFLNRDYFLPGGKRRYWQGQPVVNTLRDVAMKFDGTNAESVFDYFRNLYALTPDGGGDRFLFAYLSEDECQRIADGTDTFIGDYLEDVVDADDGPRITLRSGEVLPVAPGALIVNCTGYVLGLEQERFELVSDRGLILTISSRNAIHFLSTVSSYFLSHLFFSGKMEKANLYSIDMDRLFEKDSKVWAMSAATLGFMNMISLIAALPTSVMNRCGLDLDQWYPLYRRIGGLVDISLRRQRYLDHCRQSLDRVAHTYGEPIAAFNDTRPASRSAG